VGDLGHNLADGIIENILKRDFISGYVLNNDNKGPKSFMKLVKSSPCLLNLNKFQIKRPPVNHFAYF